jgi:hypothetical protein
MTEYVLDHHLAGECARLAPMSRLLDPMHRRHLEALGVRPGMRAVEVGAGLVELFLARCKDLGWWTQTIAFTGGQRAEPLDRAFAPRNAE